MKKRYLEIDADATCAAVREHSGSVAGWCRENGANRQVFYLAVSKGRGLDALDGPRPGSGAQPVAALKVLRQLKDQGLLVMDCAAAA